MRVCGGAVLINLPDIGRPIPLWVAPFPWPGIQNCTGVKKSRRAQQITSKQISMHACISPCSWLQMHCDWHLKFLPWFPTKMDCNMKYPSFFLSCLLSGYLILAAEMKLVHQLPSQTAKFEICLSVTLPKPSCWSFSHWRLWWLFWHQCV